MNIPHTHLSRRHLLKSAAVVSIGATLAGAMSAIGDLPPAILSTSASEKRIEFTLQGEGPSRLLAFPIHADSTRAQAGNLVWEGDLHAETKIVVDRFIGPIDRLFQKFRLFHLRHQYIFERQW